MAAHGVARATLDTDILVVDPSILDRGMWTNALGSSAKVDVRQGDGEDPLRGLVRIERRNYVVDIVVGRGKWQDEILARTIQLDTPDGDVPVVDVADLILLKLYAGGPQDLLDVDLLLADAAASVRTQIEERIAHAPKAVQETWASRHG
jgi:hypothetical protein